jgi:hypothetical protein
MMDAVSLEYVLARWAYSELLSPGQRSNYARARLSDQLVSKARAGAPFDELGQADRDLLLQAWCDVRGVFACYLAGIARFRPVNWSRDDLAAVLRAVDYDPVLASHHRCGH